MNSNIAHKLFEAHKLSNISLENIMSTYTSRVTKMMDRERSKGYWVNWLDSDCKYGEKASDIILRYSQMHYKPKEFYKK